MPISVIIKVGKNNTHHPMLHKITNKQPFKNITVLFSVSGRTYSTPVDSTKIAKLTKTIVMLADTVDSRNASQKE